MPTVVTKQDSGVQMADPGRAPVVLGSTLNNKLIFEKRVPLDPLVTGNGTMSIKGFARLYLQHDQSFHPIPERRRHAFRLGRVAVPDQAVPDRAGRLRL
jgi:hypothetical protein